MALVLVAVAAATVAATALTSGRVVALARRDAEAAALSTERAELLRAGPRADGADAAVGTDATPFARAWRVTRGRGRPDRFTVSVAWPDHAIQLDARAMP